MGAKCAPCDCGQRLDALTYVFLASNADSSYFTGEVIAFAWWGDNRWLVSSELTDAKTLVAWFMKPSDHS